MPPSGCTITSLFQLWSPQGCCNFVVSLIRYGLSLSLFFFAHVFSRFGYPLAGDPFTHAHASQAKGISRWLVFCSARVCFQFGCYLFWCPFTHAHAPQAQRFSRWLISCTAHVCFSFRCYLSGALLPTLIVSQAQRFSRWLVSCSARFFLLQFGCYLLWSTFLCFLRSLAPVLSAQ